VLKCFLHPLHNDVMAAMLSSWSNWVHSTQA